MEVRLHRPPARLLLSSVGRTIARVHTPSTSKWLNMQLPCFVSWQPEPAAIAVDAFHFPRIGENAWCFVPKVLIGRLLSAVIRQRAMITLITPPWPSQLWWLDLQLLHLDKSLILPSAPTTL